MFCTVWVYSDLPVHLHSGRKIWIPFGRFMFIIFSKSRLLNQNDLSFNKPFFPHASRIRINMCLNAFNMYILNRMTEWMKQNRKISCQFSYCNFLLFRIKRKIGKIIQNKKNQVIRSTEVKLQINWNHPLTYTHTYT